jgi:hypothetical protein
MLEQKNKRAAIISKSLILFGGYFRARTCDNQCFGPGFKGEGIYCVVEEKLRQKEQQT